MFVIINHKSRAKLAIKIKRDGQRWIVNAFCLLNLPAFHRTQENLI